MRSRDEWEREADTWIRFAQTRGHDHWYELLNLPSFLELLPSTPGTLIDLGCGEGRLGTELTARGFEVLGVDSSPTLVQAAARRESPVIHADAARLPLRPEICDMVVFFMSLQDMDDASTAVAEASRILRPGGRLYIATLHPMNTAGAFTSEDDDADFLITESYFGHRLLEDIYERDGIAMRFVQHHRPLSYYFAAMEDAGLVLETVREIKANDALMALSPTRARWTKIPIFLHLVARKDGSNDGQPQ